MQEATDWTEKYYSPKAVEALRERLAAMTPEQWVKIGDQWKALFADLQSALDREVPPDSAEARTLVHAGCAWATSSRSEIRKCRGMAALHDDQSHWPDDERAERLRRVCPNLSIGPSFIRRFKPACGTANHGFLHST